MLLQCMFVFLYFLAIPPINTTALNKNSTSLHFLLLTTPPISKEKERLVKNSFPDTSQNLSTDYTKYLDKLSFLP